MILTPNPTAATFHADLHCPSCGSQWARMPCTRAQAEFYPLRRHCRGCAARSWCSDLSAGTLHFDPSGLGRATGYEHLDRALLIRELDLDLSEAEAARGSLQWVRNPAIINPLTYRNGATMDSQAMLQVLEMRTRATEGTITDDELRAAVKLLRAGRMQAARSAVAKATPKPAIDGAGVLALFTKPAA